MSRPAISYPSPLPSSESFRNYTPADTNAVQGPSYPSQPSSSSLAQTQQAQRIPSASSSRSQIGALDSQITRLLVNTKQMLQSLDQWATGVIDEEAVSDIYVRLGNGFEVCVVAFHRAGISTTELDSIPSDLRDCLEQCLAETPSPETLQIYLPGIRSIIYNLLNGLKQKQAAYKRLVQDRQPTPAQAGQSNPTNAPDHQPPARSTPSPGGQASSRPGLLRDADSSSRLSARSNTSNQSGPTSPSSPTSQLPPGKGLSDRPRQAASSRPAPPDAFRPARTRPVPDQPARSTPSPGPPFPTSSSNQDIPAAPSTPVVRHQLTDNPVPRAPRPSDASSAAESQSTTRGPTPPPKPPPPRPDRFSRDSYGNPRQISRFSADSDITNGSPVRSPPTRSPPAHLGQLEERDERSDLSESPGLPYSQPPTLPTLNLPSDSIRLTDSPPRPQPQAAPDIPIESRATLAALSRSDALERRASKRYSSYTFDKLPGSPKQKNSSTLGSPNQRPARRLDRLPPMPALPETFGSTNLGPKSTLSTSPDSRAQTSSASSSMLLAANGTPNGDPSRPASPMSSQSHVSESDQEGSFRSFRTPEPMEQSLQETPRAVENLGTSLSADSVTVFLQVGKHVKKVTVEKPVSLSALRLLFMEKFEYDPGMEDFPDVYLRDTKTGVQFELEDMDDVSERCLLLLNIEPLDQVKQHFDITFGQMMREFKEMKTALDHAKRHSVHPPASLHALLPGMKSPHTMPMAMNPSMPSSPLQEKGFSLPPPTSPSMSSGLMQISGKTNAKSSESEFDPARQARLQTYQDEIETLRQDLAVMRQVHVDFFGESKEALTKLRKENDGMRELVKTKMGGSRPLLDVSKTKLETLCADTIQAVEEISDIIDGAREDAFRRYVTPSKAQMSNIQADLQKASDMVDAFAREVTSVEPTWRATWHLELSRVMEEQKLLPHQAKLTMDLKNDILDATKMLQNVQDFVDQRAAAGPSRNPSKNFRPPTPDADGGMPNLLAEIRTKDSDPTSRLRAIEAQQKAREREKANRTDDFEQELTGFVQGRRLKKTGGTEETERKTQRRQDMTLKKMFTGDGMAAQQQQGSNSSPGSGSGSGGVLSPQMTGKSVKSIGTLSPQVTGRTSGSFRSLEKGQGSEESV